MVHSLSRDMDHGPTLLTSDIMPAAPWPLSNWRQRWCNIFWCLVRGQERFTTVMHPLWCLLTGLCSLCIIFIFLNGVKQTVTSIMDTNLHPGCHNVQCLPTVWVSNDGLGNTKLIVPLFYKTVHKLIPWFIWLDCDILNVTLKLLPREKCFHNSFNLDW